MTVSDDWFNEDGEIEDVSERRSRVAGLDLDPVNVLAQPDSVLWVVPASPAGTDRLQPALAHVLFQLEDGRIAVAVDDVVYALVGVTYRES